MINCITHKQTVWKCDYCYLMSNYIQFFQLCQNLWTNIGHRKIKVFLLTYFLFDYGFVSLNVGLTNMASRLGKIAVGGLTGTAGAGLAAYLLLNEHHEPVSWSVKVFPAF